MLVMQNPVFRRFWYPTVALHDLASGPKPFTLPGQKLVLWADADGAPVAFHDRRPHRGVALSMGSKVIDGALRCEKAPVALHLHIIDEPETLGFRCDLRVINTPEQQGNLRIATAETCRPHKLAGESRLRCLRKRNSSSCFL